MTHYKYSPLSGQWASLATNNFPNTVRELGASIMIRDTLLYYAVNSDLNQLLQCHFFTGSGGQGCLSVTIDGVDVVLPAGVLYVGASASPSAYRVVYWSVPSTKKWFICDVIGDIPLNVIGSTSTASLRPGTGLWNLISPQLVSVTSR